MTSIDAARLVRHYVETSSLPPGAGDLFAGPLFRYHVLREIHANFRPALAPLLRSMMDIEIMSRERDDELDEFFENLYYCAFLLFRVGDVRDVMLLWEAKNINMDTGVGLDIQWLVGAGVEETIAYLERQTSEEARNCLSYIRECQVAGDFDDLDSRKRSSGSYWLDLDRPDE